MRVSESVHGEQPVGRQDYKWWGTDGTTIVCGFLSAASLRLHSFA